MSTPHEKLPEKLYQIWDLYLNPQSQYLVNIDENTLLSIKDKLDKPNEVDSNLLREAERQIFAMLKYGPFLSWQMSQDFKNVTSQNNLELK